MKCRGGGRVLCFVNYKNARFETGIERGGFGYIVNFYVLERGLLKRPLLLMQGFF